mgnify:FL=1
MFSCDTFTVDHSPRSIFGIDSHKHTGAVLQRYGCRKALVVFDPMIGQLGIADKVITSIASCGIETICFGTVKPEPDSDTLNRAGELGRSHCVDCVVGIGGGSSLDTAKGANLLLSNPGPIEDYIGVNRGKRDIIKKHPLILLPTTARTSAELTPVFVVSESSTGKKTGASNRGDVAIIDPSFEFCIPPQATAATGLDMLAHVTESLINPKRHWLTELLDEQVISLVFRYLPRAYEDGSDIEARCQLAYACMLAGYAMSDKGTYIGHAVADRITNQVHCAHSVACAPAILVALRYAVLACPEKLRPVARAIGLDLSLDDTALADTVLESYRTLIRKLNLNNLRSSGIDSNHLRFIAADLPHDNRWNRTPAPDAALARQALEMEWSIG